MMNKSILFLVVFGFALAVFCVPHAMLTLSIIIGLVILSIKLFWKVLEGFSTSPSVAIDPHRRPTRRTSFT